MADSARGASGDAGPIAEYVALRAEFERRATGQWSVLALQIGVAGAIFGFALSAPFREIFLLAVPIASYTTCGRYVIHARGLRLITYYIREELAERIPGGLHWEEWRENNLRRFPVGHFGVAHFTGVVFPGVAVLALLAFVLEALADGLAEGKPWYMVAAVSAVVVADTVLVVLMVQSLWVGRTFPHA
jgi:hypothetical protein